MPKKWTPGNGSRSWWGSPRSGPRRCQAAPGPTAGARREPPPPAPRTVPGRPLHVGDELLDPFVHRLERVLAQHRSLGLVVELEVHPVHRVVAALLLGLA